MKNIIMTGATGFLGYALLLELIEQGFHVTELHRKNSKHLARLERLDTVTAMEYDLDHTDGLKIDGNYDTFYHLAWEGGRNDFAAQYINVERTLNCLRLAVKLGCKRFICTGTQAEYGEVPATEIITEETPLNPTTAYGSCKVAAYYLTKDLARRLNIEHTWVRPFSIYGKHDNPGAMLPQLIKALSSGREFSLASDGSHTWNYLHEEDAARGLRLIGESDVTNTVFNLADNVNKPLREFAEAARLTINPAAELRFGDEINKVNLNVSMEKLERVTGWKPEKTFGKESLI